MLRAPSSSAKKEWMQLLKERASGSLARKRPGEKVRAAVYILVSKYWNGTTKAHMYRLQLVEVFHFSAF